MLQGRILRTGDQREYVSATFNGTNMSGLQPIDDKVLLLMDQHSDKTSGGVIVPEDTRSRQTMASEGGVIVALGDGAFKFNDDATRRLEALQLAPRPGDRVVVERYAGRVVQGVDGVEYRLVSQRAIGAIYERPEAA